MSEESKPGLWSQVLVELTTYLRAMSVFVFLGVGGTAVTMYPEIAFPLSPLIAVCIGVLLVFTSLFLCVWLAVDAVARWWTKKSYLVTMALVAFVLLPTVCVVVAQITASGKALTRVQVVHEAR